MDGRYREKTEKAAVYFSEMALIRYRVRVEVEYFIELCREGIRELNDFPVENYPLLRSLYENFSLEDARQVKELEAVTNHDIKAVEYFLKNRFREAGWDKWSEFIHFGLTSQDINNTAMPLAVKEFVQHEYLPTLEGLIADLSKRAEAWRQVPMLARTHGQPASPTGLGKEFLVFIERLQYQLALLNALPFQGKLGGATGNFNAHIAAYPDIDWPGLADRLLNRLGLQRQHFTTQIEHYDMLAALLHNIARINTILTDCCRDCWMYISLDYFTQKISEKEVGSSTMPHKVNPIDFENAEGNFGIANAMFNHLAGKLPVSRLQRDLTDSTASRNLGVPFAHSLLGIASLQKGLEKLQLNETSIREDLQAHWAVVSEGIQTILRKAGYPKPYEALKALTRGKNRLTDTDIKEFIRQLNIDEETRQQLLALTPWTYTGNALK